MKKNWFLFLVLTMLLTIDTYAGFVAVHDGKAMAEIIIPQKPSKTELFAAEELQIYIKKICGTTLQIRKTSQISKMPAFIIGNNSVNSVIQKKLNSKYPKKYDRFAIVCKENSIHFVAPHSSGLLFSVWSWLENKQGVAWLMPGSRGTYIPKRKEIKVSDCQKYLAPAFEYRHISTYGVDYSRKRVGGPESLLREKEHGHDAVKLWPLRLRLNGTSFDEKDHYYNIGAGHSYAYYIPASRYAKKHPKWFYMVGGRRLTAKDAEIQVCFTNKEAAKQFAQNMLVAIKGYLKKGVPLKHLRINVSPNDGRAICECSNCVKLKDSDGTSSSLVLNFANMVAAEIQKTYPDAKIYYYVYNNYGRIPEHVKPGKGVIPWITSWTSKNGLAVNHAHSLFSDKNTRYRNVYKWFAENSDAVSTYTYYCHYTWLTPFPVITQIEKDIKGMNNYAKNGQMYVEAHHQWGTQGLTFYLLPKLLWNPNLDVKKAINGYCKKAYGPAARFAKIYFATLQKKMDSLSYICGTKIEIPTLLTPKVIATCDELMNSAETKLKDMEPCMRWRTELLISAWRNSAKFAKANNLVRTGRTPQCQKIVKKLLDEVKTYANTDMGRWAFEHRQTISELRTTGVDFNLVRIPIGKHVWSDSLMYGGTLNFYAKYSKNIFLGIWGYCLKPKSSGQIEIPLQATSGLKFKSVHCKFKGPMQLYVSAPGVSEVLVSSNSAKACSIPKKLMGKNKVKLILKYNNKSAIVKYVLTKGEIKVDVVK